VDIIKCEIVRDQKMRIDGTRLHHLE